MIEITRALARQFLAVLRKSAPPGSARGSRPMLTLYADDVGLRLRAQHPQVALEYHQSGARPSEALALPGTALDDFAGSRDAVVTLESVGPDTVQARWDDAGVPQVRDYSPDHPDKQPPFPEAPETLVTQEAGCLKALSHAAQVAANQSVRYALDRLQLRGAAGKVIATDGKQLLVQTGFTFPWKQDVLVPAIGAFACRELSQDAAVAIGKTDTHVGIRVGPWTFYLAIDTHGRYPNAEDVIPSSTGSATTCRLSPEDAIFLAKALPRLPGRSEDHEGLTLDLNGHFMLRAKAEGQSRATEVVLSRSDVTGPPVRLVSDRLYLARALQFGFGEFRLKNADAPVVCREAHRTYVWMPLSKEGALAPSDHVIRIASSGDDSPPAQPQNEGRTTAMTTPQNNGRSNGEPNAHPTETNGEDRQRNSTSIGALIAEAEALKAAVREVYGRSTRLVVALKRHGKQSKLVSTTLASLRQLQQIDG